MVGRPFLEFLSFTLCLLLPAAGAQAGSDASTAAIVRFRQVDAALYRGGERFQSVWMTHFVIAQAAC